MRIAAAAVLAAGVGMMAGCGNTYRPVVSTIGMVGPAGQPTKYAIAVSTPTKTSVSGARRILWARGTRRRPITVESGSELPGVAVREPEEREPESESG